MTPLVQRADDRDRVGRAAFHLLGQVADGAAAGENAAGALLHGHHRRLVEHQPFADHADQRVGRSQIDGQVGAEVVQEVVGASVLGRGIEGLGMRECRMLNAE